MLTAGGRNRSHRNLHFSLTAVKRTILLVELSFLSTSLSQSFFFFFFFFKNNNSLLSTSLSQSIFSPKKQKQKTFIPVYFTVSIIYLFFS